MSGTRLSVCAPGADAGTLVDLARLGEGFGTGVWAGALTAGPSNADDSYVLTAAAAMAAATSTIRVGVVLGLRGTATPLRLAEDIGVVDQASGGRIDIALRPPTAADDAWDGDVGRLFDAWTHWPTVAGRSVAATPRPAQPSMPRLLVGTAGRRGQAERLHAGLLVPPGGDAGTADPSSGRVAVAVSIDDPGGARSWLAGDPVARVVELREHIDAAGADELVVVLPEERRRGLVDDMRTLAVVVGSSTRCSAHHVEFFATDSWHWLTESVRFHDPPE
jgi:hypothetical protein